MLSRALILAAVTLFIASGSSGPASAQNLDAGKSPGQIFASTCAVCHKSPRGLMKTVSPGALPGFLRQHYTTGTAMATSLSAYLTSNGAADPRARDTLTRQGREAKQGGAPEPAAEPRRGRRESDQAARPDADGLQGAPERGRRDPNSRRAARPEPGSPEAQPAGEAAHERTPGGRKQRVGKRGKPEEQVKPEEQAKPAHEEPRKDDVAAKPDATKPLDEAKPDAVKPDAAAPADAAKPAAPGDDGAKTATPTRPDPVPAVTPAPKPAEPGEARSAQAPAPSPGEGAAPEKSASEPPVAPPPAPPVAASPPPAPAGPPEPPISR